MKNKKLVIWNIEKWLVYTFLLLHLLLSQIIFPRIDVKEFFPVYTWRLFPSCNTSRTIPEIEVSYFDGTVVKNITRQQFPMHLSFQTHFLMKTLFEANKNTQKAYETEQFLLNKISAFLGHKPFKYQIFQSKVDIIPYFKKQTLKKDRLFKEGSFHLKKEKIQKK